jgi:hypothetical protein
MLFDSDMVSVLLEAQNMHSRVNVILGDNSDALTSVVLGFDYYEKTLLIDGFIPPLDRSNIQNARLSPFCLQLKHLDGYLNLSCRLLETLHDLHTLTIVDGEFTQNRRWNARLYFDNREGPTFSFSPLSEPKVSGSIRNLSADGACIEFLGRDITVSLQRLSKFTSNIAFNEQFHIQLECEVKQVRFLRIPCCHSLLRVAFTSYRPVIRAQLENFIDSLHDYIDS